MSDNTPIYVTRPSLPPLDEFVPFLQKIWASGILTNSGPFHKEFEQTLCSYLGVKYCSLFCNGMSALQVGLQALRVTGEVITTPYSFVATTHAIYWNRCTPVFCDIDPTTCNIDASKIESLITPQTTAIMPVHVYGTPCDIDAITRIADTYGLKVLYDAAHGFGVRINGESIFNFGDLSMASFHATKIFTTFEGGALFTNDLQLKQRIDYLKNFGFAGETTVIAPGGNGKMNELQAACGLLSLKKIDSDIQRSKDLSSSYRRGLASISGLSFLPEQPESNAPNYSYFPIFIEASRFGQSRDALYERLKMEKIFTRRYFYPLISSFATYKHLPSASESLLREANLTSKAVLCLPIYPDLSDSDTQRIISAIHRIHNNPF